MIRYFYKSREGWAWGGGGRSSKQLHTPLQTVCWSPGLGESLGRLSRKICGLHARLRLILRKRCAVAIDAKRSLCSKENKKCLITKLNMSDHRNVDLSAPGMAHPLWKPFQESFYLQDQRKPHLSRFTWYSSGNARRASYSRDPCCKPLMAS